MGGGGVCFAHRDTTPAHSPTHASLLFLNPVHPCTRCHRPSRFSSLMRLTLFRLMVFLSVSTWHHPPSISRSLILQVRQHKRPPAEFVLCACCRTSPPILSRLLCLCPSCFCGVYLRQHRRVFDVLTHVFVYWLKWCATWCDSPLVPSSKGVLCV